MNNNKIEIRLKKYIVSDNRKNNITNLSVTDIAKRFIITMNMS
jgi:hypothetical protein